MLPSFRFAGITFLFLAFAGIASAQEEALPSVPGVSIHKVTFEHGTSVTVKYYVKGGSPRLKAIVRRLQWAENEMSLIEELQLLKTDIVANERSAQPVLTLQRIGYSPPPPFGGGFYGGGYWGGGYGGCGGGESSLAGGLSGVLVGEATPEAAVRAIGLLEQAQTELDAELKKLQKEEQEAARGYVEKLRKMVASLTRQRDAAPARPLPVATRRPPVSNPVLPFRYQPYAPIR